ncbi:DUF6452 family protein [Flavicella marina]|uniref:DUF6452 family protein n=1 Tax=Flavicella marina TaxID=1475951 RepID=UPI0012650600|nr:DUF6452 family protein [Flavicella marina]
MKKILFVFLILLSILTSCEDDDFCEETTTPRLIIGFYDKENPSAKKVVPLYAWADGKDSIYELSITDSILIPLDTRSTSTKYRLSTLNTVDTLDLSYTTTDVFLSESCGYIAHFTDFGIEKATLNWISSIDVNVTRVENETETHIKIYH